MIKRIKNLFTMRKVIELQQQRIDELKKIEQVRYVVVAPPPEDQEREYQRLLALLTNDQRYLWYMHDLKRSFYADFESGTCSAEALKGALSVLYRIFDDSQQAQQKFEAKDEV